MFLRFLISIVFFLFSISNSYPQQKIEIFYNISCDLDVKEKVLKGIENIKFTNNSSTSFKELYLNLNMNALANPSSSFFKEFLLLSSSIELPLKNFGGMDILSIKFNDAEIKENLLFISPEDGNKDDRTLAVLTLPSPILPRQSVSIEIKFLTKIPENIMGIGYIGDFFFVSNWYPKLSAIEEKDGSFIWDYHQVHLFSFPISNFASYRVELNVPRNFRVGATGNKVFEKKVGKKKITRFYAENVNDFAWVASPSFLEYRSSFVPEKDLPLKEFKRLDPDKIADKIEITLLIRPERKVYKERYFKIIKEAIRHYWLNFFKYPYSNITLVDFPSADVASEIVSPNLIVINHPIFSPRDYLNLERNILRNVGFQYWCNIIKSNEVDRHWLGNGLSSYSEGLILKEAFNEPVLYRYLSFIPIPYIEPLNLPLFGFYFLKVREKVDESLIIEYLRRTSFDPIRRNPWEFESFNSYFLNTKIKPALIFLTIERNFGKRKLLVFLRNFFKKYTFRKFDVDDFMKMTELEIGLEARRLFEYFLFKTDSVDFRVAEVKNSYLKGENGNTFISSVLIEKKGALVFPVDVEIFFKGGYKVIERWDGEGNWKRFLFKGKIEKVVIDPYEKFLLDENRFNNSMLVKKRKAPFLKALALWNILIEEFLHNLLFFI